MCAHVCVCVYVLGGGVGEWGGWKERKTDSTKITPQVTEQINKQVTIICTGREKPAPRISNII